MDVAKRQFISISVALLFFCGCQMGPDPSIELLESELRWMEDQLYDMDRALTKNCRALEVCQRENASLRHQLASGGGSSDRNTGDGSQDRSRGTSIRSILRGSESDSNPSASSSGGGNGLAPPAVDVPNFEEDELEIPEVDLGPGGSYPEFQPDDDPPNSAALEQLKISRIVLNGRMTSGYGQDGHPARAGLLLVVEPQNERGQFVPLPGEIDISVYDYARPGSLAQVGRWQLSEADVLPLIKDTLVGRGIHLRIPWNRTSSTQKLAVQVEYRPPNGRPLMASKKIHRDTIAQRSSQPEASIPGRPDLPMRRSGPLRYAPIPRPPQHLVSTVPTAPPSAPSLNYRTGMGSGFMPQPSSPTVMQQPLVGPNSSGVWQAERDSSWQPTRR